MSLSDTNKKTEEMIVAGFRKMPAWKKLELLSQMTDMCRQLALAGLRSRHPGESQTWLKCHLAARILDRLSVVKAYGWDPETEGY